MNTSDTLEEMGLFQGLPAAELAALAQNAAWKHYNAGEFVFHQGDAATHDAHGRGAGRASSATIFYGQGD